MQGWDRTRARGRICVNLSGKENSSSYRDLYEAWLVEILVYHKSVRCFEFAHFWPFLIKGLDLSLRGDLLNEDPERASVGYHGTHVLNDFLIPSKYQLCVGQFRVNHSLIHSMSVERPTTQYLEFSRFNTFFAIVLKRWSQLFLRLILFFSSPTPLLNPALPEIQFFSPHPQLLCSTQHCQRFNLFLLIANSSSQPNIAREG